MKLLISIMLVALVGFVAAGCANKNKNTTASADSSVLDVSAPAPSGPSAYTPPQPIAAQPVTYDTMPNNTTGTAGGIGGGPYTVRKGDTLYSIARNRYGSGKEWQRITAANPGLRPESLKVGQTITVP